MTCNVELERVPESLRAMIASRRAADGRIRIGLNDAWSLAAAFDGDPLGAAFSTAKHRLLSFLTIRNESLFAHGCRPVSDADYHNHGRFVETFIADAIGTAIADLKLPRRASLQQFPVRID